MSNYTSKKSMGTTHRLPSLPKGLVTAYYRDVAEEATHRSKKPKGKREERRIAIAADLRRWTPERVRLHHKCARELINSLLLSMNLGAYGGLRGVPLTGLREDRADS